MPYTLTQENYRRLKGRLTRVVNQGDPAKIKAEVEAAMKIFEEQGYPDDWARWQRAANDAVWAAERKERGI